MAQDVDISSYRLPEATNPLDTAAKLGSLQQQKIGIDQSKLKLMNDRYQILNKELSTLMTDPDVEGGTPSAPTKVLQSVQNLVKLGIIPGNMSADFIKQIPADPKLVPQFLQQTISRAQDINSAVNTHYGVPGEIDNGQTTQPVTRSPIYGTRSTGAPIQQQPPPTTQTLDANNRPTMLGAKPPDVAPGSGAVTAPPMRQDLRNRLPVATPAPAAAPPADTNRPASFADRFQPRGPVQGMPPMFEEGKKQYAADQQTALENFSNIMPVVKAYHMLDGLRSGPGTAQWNNALAFLKANKIIPIEANDPTAIYQEVNKYLSQRVQASGSRSDAALAGAEVSNPNVGKQISPALQNLTKNAIVMDRARALVPLAFEGNNFEKYGEHRSKFPTQLDQRALAIDLLKPKERDTLVNEMEKKQNTLEGKRFWNTIRLLDKHQLVDTSTSSE